MAFLIQLRKRRTKFRPIFPHNYFEIRTHN